MKLTRPLVFFDLETSGIDPAVHRIVEASFLKVDPSGLITQKSYLLNPEVPIDPEATAVHGYSNEDLKWEPTFTKKAQEIYDFIEGCDLAGHNAIRFDVPFLEAQFAALTDLRLDTDSIFLVDTMKIYHHFHTRTLTDAVRVYLNRDHSEAHSAGADTTACREVLLAQLATHDLPTTVPELDAFCRPIGENSVDREGKLVWIETEICINFGKNKGKSLKSLIASGDHGYLEWILKNDFSKKVKHVARQALKGKFLTRSTQDAKPHQ